MKFPVRIRSWQGGCALLVAVVLAGFALLLVLWAVKPPLEWVGAREALFDSAAQRYAPKGASRIFYFHDNFGMDWARWTAFTAPPAAVESFLRSKFEVQLSAFKAWDRQNFGHILGRFDVIDQPSRANWRNRGYWDIEESPSGLLYEKMWDGAHYLRIFYDPVKSRIFLMEGSI